MSRQFRIQLDKEKLAGKAPDYGRISEQKIKIYQLYQQSRNILNLYEEDPALFIRDFAKLQDLKKGLVESYRGMAKTISKRILGTEISERSFLEEQKGY